MLKVWFLLKESFSTTIYLFEFDLIVLLNDYDWLLYVSLESRVY